jgi:trans-aconitate methyltransferase
VTDIGAKYAALAEGFAEREYADPAGYSARRARTIGDLGPRLPAGASLLDLCCADGIMAAPLTESGLRYTGVDASPAMLEAARRRNPGLEFTEGLMESYSPPEPVDATICLRSFYLAEDRVAFFRHVLGYTRVKFVFDFRQPAHPADLVVRDLRAAGFTRIELRPFFMPQRRALPGPAARALEALERAGPLASLLSRRFGRMFCSASA